MGTEVKILIGIGLGTLVLLTGAVLIFSRGSTPANSNTPVDPSLLIRANSNQTASSSAKLNVVEFGDYQCPSCGAAYPLLKQMLSDYSGQVNLVFRNFPLPMHQNALIAAEAAEAAGAQGKYWLMHDLLYDKQTEWADSSDPLKLFDTYAQSINLDLNRFNADVTSNKYSSKIQEDQTDGNFLGINATPTIYINNVQAFVGVPTYDQLKSKLDSILAK